MNCKRCGYNTRNKCDLKSHLQRKNVCSPILEDIDVNILYNEYFEKKNKLYKCDYCDKTYSFLSGKSCHVKNCSKKIEFELQQTNQLELLKKEFEDYKKENPRQLDETGVKTLITNNNNHITNNTINNITINAFGKENIQYLSNDPKYMQIMLNCLNTKEQGIMHLIKYIYFNPEHPENHNVKKTIKNDNYMKTYNGKEWNLSIATDGLFSILQKIESEFSIFLEKMEDEGTRVKDPLMKKFMVSVGYALNFEFSSLKHPPPDCQIDDKQLDKMNKTLLTLFLFFINEKTNELINPTL